MKLTVLKIAQKTSKQGGRFWYVFLKSDVGTSFKTCIYPAYGNYKRCGWDKVIASGIGTVIEYSYLPLNARGLLDADKVFRLLPKENSDTELEAVVRKNNLIQETKINEKAVKKQLELAI
jgi:hypothetical protein